MDDPILIWGSGFRTGSTLLQRLLCAVPDTMIWGESNDALGLVLRATLRVRQWQGLADEARRDFAKNSTESWIANIHPPSIQAIEALRGWVQTMYARTPDGHPALRWGVKELTLEPEEVEVLWQAFPRLRVLFIVRHPRPMMASMVGTGWYNGEPRSAAATRWARRVSWAFACHDPRLLVVRYERLLSDPAIVFAELAAHLDLPVRTANQRVLDSIVRGTKLPPTLDAEAEAALRLPALLRAMASAGFEVEEMPRALTAGAEDLPDGRGRLFITFDEQQQWLELFVRKNGIQIFAGFITPVRNPDGTYTYHHMLDGLVPGDFFQYRFFVNPPAGARVFLPGPGESNWHVWSCPGLPMPRTTSCAFIARTEGRGEFSLTTTDEQQYVELFVRRNGLQIVANPITGSGTRKDDGSFVYGSVVEPFADGDQIEYRFYYYPPAGAGRFSPGPGPDAWTTDEYERVASPDDISERAGTAGG